MELLNKKREEKQENFIDRIVEEMRYVTKNLTIACNLHVMENTIAMK